MSNAPPTTQLATSNPLNAGQFALSVMCRFLQGLSVCAVIYVAAGQELDLFATDSLVFAFACLLTAAVLCGSGLNISLERLVSSILGARTGCLATALFPVLGMSLVSEDGTCETPMFVGLLVGLGIGSDWSTVSEVARRSLPTRSRWQGMRIWTVAFPLGVFVAILLRHNYSTVFNVVILLSASIFGSLFFVKLTRQRVPMEPAVEPSATEQSIRHPSASETETLAGDTEECDVEECCGGGISIVRPTTFWHGVLLAATGLLCLYMTMCLVFTSQYHRGNSATTTFAIGLPIGFLLMVTVAPRIGYVVALLPFLLLGAVSVAATGLLPFNSQWLSCVTFCCGLFSAAAACGISAVVGELFSDCPTDARRSRVLSVALFASAAIMVAVGLLRLWLQSVSASGVVCAAVFVIGLLAVRSLPSPVISSLGRDNDNSSDDEELNDVLAAINN